MHLLQQLVWEMLKSGCHGRDGGISIVLLNWCMPDCAEVQVNPETLLRYHAKPLRIACETVCNVHVLVALQGVAGSDAVFGSGH